MFRKALVVALLSSVMLAVCPDDKMCMACNEAKCELCYKSFPNKDGVCTKPGTEIDKCESYASETACAACDWGYKVENGKCVKITISKCHYAEANAKDCTACADQILVENGKCDGSKKCTDANCDVCAKDLCLECKDGYSVSGKTTQCIKEPVEACWLTDPEEKACLNCHIGYYDNNGKCVKSSLRLLVNAIAVLVLGFSMA